MAVVLSEPLRLEQRVGEVNEQPHGHQSGERIIEKHGALPHLEQIAGVNVCNRQREEGETNRQHGDIHHEMLRACDL